MIVFLAYERHVTSLQEIVRANSEAMTKLVVLFEKQCNMLTEHDDRAEVIHNDVKHCSEAISRLEPVIMAQNTTQSRPK